MRVRLRAVIIGLGITGCGEDPTAPVVAPPRAVSVSAAPSTGSTLAALVIIEAD